MNHAWRSVPAVALTALAATGAWGQSASVLRSGIDIQFFDTSVRAQDDFYQYVNGKWLATTDIPSDRPAYGADVQLYDDAQRALGELIKDAAAHSEDVSGSDASKIADRCSLQELHG
jgi:putative endopeptidase